MTTPATQTAPTGQTQRQKRRLGSRVGLFSDLDPRVRAQLDAYGLTAVIGAANLHGDIPIEELIRGAESAGGSPSAGG